MVARVFVTLKPGVLDPAGKAVERSLHALGYEEVGAVRLGKYVELKVDEARKVQKRIGGSPCSASSSFSIRHPPRAWSTKESRNSPISVSVSDFS